jgi:hypothetical protein
MGVDGRLPQQCQKQGDWQWIGCEQKTHPVATLDQANKNGMIFVTVAYGGQSAMVAIEVGDDEVFESGFE